MTRPADCIRRSDAEWSSCRCEPCKRKRRRLRKVRQLNGPPPDQSTAAWAVLERMVADGWSREAIASATGLSTATAWGYLAAIRRGERIRLGAPHARRVLAHTEPTAGYVGATGTRRRLQALAVIGYSLEDLAARTGVPLVTLSCIRRDGGVKSTRPGHARTIAEAFDRLSLTPGPSTDARRRALAYGWAAPLAWDDIDRDTAPNLATGDDGHMDEIAIARAVDRGGVELTRAERVEVVRRMAAAGFADPAIAAHTNVNRRTVERIRKDHDIPSRVGSDWRRAS